MPMKLQTGTGLTRIVTLLRGVLSCDWLKRVHESSIIALRLKMLGAAKCAKHEQVDHFIQI